MSEIKYHLKAYLIFHLRCMRLETQSVNHGLYRYIDIRANLTTLVDYYVYSDAQTCIHNDRVQIVNRLFMKDCFCSCVLVRCKGKQHSSFSEWMWGDIFSCLKRYDIIYYDAISSCLTDIFFMSFITYHWGETTTFEWTKDNFILSKEKIFKHYWKMTVNGLNTWMLILP